VEAPGPLRGGEGQVRAPEPRAKVEGGRVDLDKLAHEGEGGAKVHRRVDQCDLATPQREALRRLRAVAPRPDACVDPPMFRDQTEELIRVLGKVVRKGRILRGLVSGRGDWDLR
jgi:hypothetical protein